MLFWHDDLIVYNQKNYTMIHSHTRKIDISTSDKYISFYYCIVLMENVSNCLTTALKSINNYH